MQVLPGVIFHFSGGFPSASFYIPHKKTESIQDFPAIIATTHKKTLLLICFSVFLASIGNLTHRLGLFTPSVYYNFKPKTIKDNFIDRLNGQWEQADMKILSNKNKYNYWNL